jgi:hypothetical protein
MEKEIPKGLKTTFLVHVVLAVIFGAGFLLVQLEKFMWIYRLLAIAVVAGAILFEIGPILLVLASLRLA